MRLVLIFLSIIIPGLFTVNAQKNYREERIKHIDFIQPPYSKLRLRANEITVRNRFKYYYIDIRGLNSIYEDCRNAINNAEVSHGSTDYFDQGGRNQLSALISTAKNANSCTCPQIDSSFFKAAFLSQTGSRLFIQLDFQALMNGKTEHNFNALAVSVIKSLAAFETGKICTCLNSVEWAQGISQLICKKMFESIPHPQLSALAPYCITQVENRSSFMLLDPDIILEIDRVEKKEIINGNDKKFVYLWQGKNLFSFEKANDGRILQNRFAVFQQGLPNNEFSGNAYQLSSFADIQNSDMLLGRPYIGLWHPPLKRNNDIRSSMGYYPVSADREPLTGNSFLLHFNSSEINSLEFQTYFESGDPYIKSAFHERNSISPSITIYINGIPKLVTVTTKLENLSSVPATATIYRKFRNTYRRIKYRNSNTLLLPNDHIKYSL